MAEVAGREEKTRTGEGKKMKKHTEDLLKKVVVAMIFAIVAFVIWDVVYFSTPVLKANAAARRMNRQADILEMEAQNHAQK